jgi:hypothetical protein
VPACKRFSALCLLTIATAAYRSALVSRKHRGRISELHHRKYPKCAVLRGGDKEASRDFERNRKWKVWHSARLAHRQHLSPRSYAYAAGDCRPGNRRSDDHGALSCVSTQEIWRTLSAAAVLAHRLRAAPRAWLWTPSRHRSNADSDLTAKIVGELRKVTVWPENLAITTPRERYLRNNVGIIDHAIARHRATQHTLDKQSSQDKP